MSEVSSVSKDKGWLYLVFSCLCLFLLILCLLVTAVLQAVYSIFFTLYQKLSRVRVKGVLRAINKNKFYIGLLLLACGLYATIVSM
ncbi:MAG: hypothetical protein ABL899_02045, partial [Nitrospira sp.]